MLSLKNKKIRIKIIEITSDHFFLEITSEEFHEIARTDGMSHTVSRHEPHCVTLSWVSLLLRGALPPSKAHPGPEEVSQGRKRNGLSTFAHLNVQKSPPVLVSTVFLSSFLSPSPPSEGGHFLLPGLSLVSSFLEIWELSLHSSPSWERQISLPFSKLQSISSWLPRALSHTVFQISLRTSTGVLRPTV